VAWARRCPAAGERLASGAAGQSQPGQLEGRHAGPLQTPEKMPVSRGQWGINRGVLSEETARDGPVSLVFTLAFHPQKEPENHICGVTQQSSMVTPESNLSLCLVFY